MSGERNEYMREYMREYRAAKKAARLAAGGESIPSRAARYTEGQGQEETTEGGGGGGIGGWLLLGVVVVVVIVACVQGWRAGTPEERADNLYKTSQALNQALNQGQDNQGQGGGGYYGYNPQ